jgi:hypothetical protein
MLLFAMLLGEVLPFGFDELKSMVDQSGLVMVRGEVFSGINLSRCAHYYIKQAFSNIILSLWSVQQ